MCVNSEFILATNMGIWHTCLFASLSKDSGTDPMTVHVALLLEKVIFRQAFLRFFFRFSSAILTVPMLRNY